MRGLRLTLAIGLLILLARLLFIQGWEGEKYAKRAARIALRETPILAPRAEIRDPYGALLAEDSAVFEAVCIRQNLKTPDYSLWQSALGMSDAELKSALRTLKQSPAYRAVRLKSDLSWEEVLRLRRHLLEDELSEAGKWQGLEIRTIPRRRYGKTTPESLAFSHLLGYERAVTAQDLSKNPALIREDRIGANGVERAFDGRLRGKNGVLWRFVDAYGREVAGEEDLKPLRIAPEPASPLLLSIDAELERFAYERFEGKSGALVAIAIPSGKVLSLVSSPGFDANLLSRGPSPDFWRGLTQNPARPLLNRATQGQYPPGSIYKIVAAAAGLESGILKATDRVYCPGSFQFGNRRFSCWKKDGHGEVDLARALEASCDVYFYTLARKLDVDRLAQTAARFGLGEMSGLLPFERAGFIPSRALLKSRYGRSFHKGDMISAIIGQGYTLLTPLQAALFLARFAGNNAAIQPSLLQDEPPSRSPMPLLSNETHARIAEGLYRVVHGGSGTAQRLRELPFNPAGKTGTAQAGVGKEDHAWFVAYAPAEAPQIAVAVLLEHGGHGGAAAAPIAADYLKQYFEKSKINDEKQK